MAAIAKAKDDHPVSSDMASGGWIQVPNATHLFFKIHRNRRSRAVGKWETSLVFHLFHGDLSLHLLVALEDALLHLELESTDLSPPVANGQSLVRTQKGRLSVESLPAQCRAELFVIFCG